VLGFIGLCGVVQGNGKEKPPALAADNAGLIASIVSEKSGGRRSHRFHGRPAAVR